MTLLSLPQVTDATNSAAETMLGIELEPTHLVEVAIITVIIIIQISISRRLASKIKRLKDLDLQDIEVVHVSYQSDSFTNFKYDYFEQLIAKEVQKGDGEDPIIHENEELNNSSFSTQSALLYSDSNLEDTQRIIKELNTYMISNDQSVISFNVIRDIVDRNYQVLDDDINQQLPTPLYLGLAATMLGIIFGLWGMMTGGESEIVDNVGSLITGVGIAMVSSFLGLIITTIFSTLVYKNSKREAEGEKNEFFSKMQAFLLPELLRQGETGIDALNKNLEKFGRVSAKSVDKLTVVAQISAQTLASQDRILERVEAINLNRVSTASARIFEKLEQNMESFERFSAYWDKLSSSLSATNQLVDNLRALSGQFEDISTVSNRIQTTLEDYNMVMSFFSEHVKTLRAGGSKAIEAVVNADVAYSDAISELRQHMSKHMAEANEEGSKLDVRMNEIGNEVAASLERSTNEHISRLTEVYSNHTPDFEHLRLLENLPSINGKISENLSSNIESNATIIQSLLDNAHQTNKSLNDLNVSLRDNAYRINELSAYRQSDRRKFSGWKGLNGADWVELIIKLVIAGGIITLIIDQIFSIL